MIIIFLSNIGTVHNNTMLSELHLASSLFAHHKGKHVLNFTELRGDMNSKTVKMKVHTGLNAAR